MSEPKVQEAIDMLECAAINCANVKKLGIPFVDVVKMQIQEAIKLLGEEPMDFDVKV